MMSQFSNMTPSLIFFWSSFVSLVMFSYCSKFHVNIVTAFWIMTIFFYKGLTREPEMGNTLVWVLPNIWRLGWVMDTKFGTNVSNRMLLNAANFQGYSFYRFWVIKGKPTGGGKIMHLKRTFLLVQKDATKEVYKYALEHLVCMEVLTQVWKYFRRYHVPVYAYKYKGNCRCKSVVAKRSN